MNGTYMVLVEDLALTGICPNIFDVELTLERDALALLGERGSGTDELITPGLPSTSGRELGGGSALVCHLKRPRRDRPTNDGDAAKARNTHGKRGRERRQRSMNKPKSYKRRDTSAKRMTLSDVRPLRPGRHRSNV